MEWKGHKENWRNFWKERERRPPTLFLLAHSYTLPFLWTPFTLLITILPFSSSISFLFFNFFFFLSFWNFRSVVSLSYLSLSLSYQSVYMPEPSRTYKDKNSPQSLSLSHVWDSSRTLSGLYQSPCWLVKIDLSFFPRVFNVSESISFVHNLIFNLRIGRGLNRGKSSASVRI